MIRFTSSRWPDLAVKVGSRVLRFTGDRFDAGPEDTLLMRHWMRQHPNAGVVEGEPAPPPAPSLDMTRAELVVLAEAAGIAPGRMAKAQLIAAIEAVRG